LRIKEQEKRLTLNEHDDDDDDDYGACSMLTFGILSAVSNKQTERQY
jgi:hypothetical protein